MGYYIQMRRPLWGWLHAKNDGTGVWWQGGNSLCLSPEDSFVTCQDAMLVALKSLMPACLFNVIGFGSTFKALFASSQTYNEVSRGEVWTRVGAGHCQGAEEGWDEEQVLWEQPQKLPTFGEPRPPPEQRSQAKPSA